MFVCCESTTVYNSNSTRDRKFFDSVTFSTRENFGNEWMDELINESLNIQGAPGGLCHILGDCSLGWFISIQPCVPLSTVEQLWI
jgi:hypothetical protein